MSQERLSNDEFLNRLTALLSSTHSENHGSVYLTQKPLTSTHEDSSSPSKILVRATNGLSKPHRIAAKPKSPKPNQPKIKLATVVEVADLDGFYARYAEVCKKGMEGLRKRDKKKAKVKAKAKKKGKTATGAAGS